MSPESADLKPKTRNVTPEGLITISEVATALQISKETLTKLGQRWPDIESVSTRTNLYSKRQKIYLKTEDVAIIKKRVTAFVNGNIPGSLPTTQELRKFNKKKRASS